MIHVVKLGGSLFDLPQLPERLRAWLAAQGTARHVLIAGGGRLVDQVRAWHAAGAIDEATAHWMSVDLLSVTARLINGWLPEMFLIDDHRLLRERFREGEAPAEPSTASQPGDAIFDAAAWMRRTEPGLPGRRLPWSWETTSDSIAGRLAVALHADELVLLKSALPPEKAATEFTALAAIGYLDPTLAQMARELPPTRLVNLRAEPVLEMRIARAGK